MNIMDLTFRKAAQSINADTKADIEFRYNINLRKKEDGVYLLAKIREIIDGGDIDGALLGWYYLWLVSVNSFLGDSDAVKESLGKCRELNAEYGNAEQEKLAKQFSALLGFDEVYSDWDVVETENFNFHYRINKESKKDIAFYAIAMEDAFYKINGFFDAKLHRKIDFFMWDSREEAASVLGRPLGFAIAQYYLIHSAHDQSLGHEMTHIISRYVERAFAWNAFISEGTAVLFDQSGRDFIKYKREWKSRVNVPDININDLWCNNFRALPENVTYPVAGFFSQQILEKFGREKYLDIIRNQSYNGARATLGEAALDEVIRETQDIINGL